MALLIYGATGFTGTLASHHALHLSPPLILGGRNASKLSTLATTLSGVAPAAPTIPTRAFAVDDPPSVIDASLTGSGVAVLLNCAGPFARTAAPLIAACIRNGVHYLDVAAELVSYRLAEKKSEDARKAGVMLMPGAGGSVAMLGCLAGRAVAGFVAEGGEKGKGEEEEEEGEKGQKKGQIARIDVALRVAGPLSRGTLASAAEASIIAQAGGCLQRVDGELVALDPGAAALFDFGDGRGEVLCVPASLPDLMTLPRSTGVEGVRTYVCAADGAFAEEGEQGEKDGPTAEERGKHPCRAAVVVVGADGRERREVLRTLNGYDFTARASVLAAKRVLEGVVEAGWQTPAGLFGNEFAFGVTGGGEV